MKHFSLLFCICSICLLSLQSPAQKISENWDSNSKWVLTRIISEKLISSSDSAFLCEVISHRSQFLKARIDSLHEAKYDYIYIVEEFDTLNDSITVTERYFSSAAPKHYKYSQIKNGRLADHTVRIANLKFINDCQTKEYNPVDPYYKGSKKIIRKIQDSLSYFGYVPALIESVILTPGCSQTHHFVEKEYERLRQVSPKVIKSSVYRIETFITKDNIFVSLQIPKEMEPVFHVKAQSF